MRRSGFLLASCVAVAATTAEAAAQPFGWLFGGPPRSARAAPTRHRMTPTQRAPQVRGEVPLPVPRPHFVEDAPRQGTPREAEGSSTATAKPSEPPPTATTNPFVAGAPAAAPAPAPPPVASVQPAPAAPPAPSPPASSATGIATSGETPLPPQKPADLGAPPAPSPATAPPAQPAIAPSGANTAFNPRQPAADAGCLDRLKAKKADAEPITIGKQPDDRCVVVQPVTLRSVALPEGSTVTFPDHPTIACTTADTFTAYVQDLLAPLAKGSFGATLSTIWTGPGLECRSRDHILGAKLSAHGQGLAVDIAQVKLADGRTLEVGTPKSDRETGFETAARAGACGYFHTVLGPGTDAYHKSHWHFDLEVRGRQGDSKYCK